MENNSNNNHSADPFWDFVRSFDPSGHQQQAGSGVDHSNTGPQFPAGFPFGGAGHSGPWAGAPWGAPWGASWGGPWDGPWGRRGGHGRFGHRHEARHDGNVHDADNDDLEESDMDTPSETMRDTPDGGAQAPPPPPPGAPHHSPPHHHPHHHGARGPFGPRRGRGGRCGRGGGRRGGRHGPPPPPYSGPFDFRPLMHALSGHPFAQALRDYAEQGRNGGAEARNEQQDESFTPPVDTFNTDNEYVIHVSLPGAAKEDIGVNWDGEKLNIAGVVYRPGSEDFLKTLASSERKVGMFERSIKLPPPGCDDKEEVDGFSISAKMENGILIVTVPKTEKEWTEIRKIDIE
ncbi:HSP20-like chaperone [Xylariomycetidae sp. FL0641]|nr:HSP20-like chaperone [Xylariomycetidae sp. FL0641]